MKTPQETAHECRLMYQAFRDAGFNTDQALQLVVAMLRGQS